MDRLYCTLDEVLTDLNTPGMKDETQLVSFIRSASQWIDRNLGNFIPIAETRKVDGEGGADLWLSRLLAIDTNGLIDDTTVLLTSDYILYGDGPGRPCWENGPYIRLSIDPDATSLGAWSNEEDIVQIAGRWGLYEESRDTGATVSSQLGAATSLVVDNGAKISPGAVLLIEDEQELVEATGGATDSTANLAEDLDNQEEEIDVDNGALINVGEIIRVDFEQMKVLDILTNKLLVERGWNNTAKVTHANATDVYVYRTFTVKRGVNGTTAAAHTTQSISRYVPPFDVGYLCRQMAALMKKKADTQYAGKTGNVDLGEVFYHSEFPKGVIERIKKNYREPLL